MAAQANIKAVITADDRASNVLKDFGDRADNVGNKISKGAVAAGVALAATATAVVAFGVSSVKSYEESENSLAQLNATLKSTGGIAGVTADMATGLANSLQKVTKFSDEEILSAQNLLLTFTKINKDIFPETTKIVLDMSTALGQDLKSSAIQVGKALQDPVLGITALRRVGVNFNDAQKEVIQNLVETGRSAEAQKLILQELATEFGGSAAAAGQTFAGKLAIIKNQFDEMKESIGKALVEAITPWVQKLSDFVASDKFQQWITNTTNFIATNLPIWIQKINEFIQNTDWQRLINDIGNVVHAFTVMGTFIGGVIDNARGVLDGFVSFGGRVLYEWQVTIENWKTLFRQLKDGVNENINLIIGFIRSAPGAVIGAFSGIANAFLAPFRSAFHGIVALWNSTVGRISFSFPSWVPGLGGKSVSVPKFASGTSFAPGGIATVGEQGPEQVFLPRGSQVIPNNSVRQSGNTTININIQSQAFMGSEQEARRFAQTIMERMKDIANMNGTSVTELLA